MTTPISDGNRFFSKYDQARKLLRTSDNVPISILLSSAFEKKPKNMIE